MFYILIAVLFLSQIAGFLQGARREENDSSQSERLRNAWEYRESGSARGNPGYCDQRPSPYGRGQTEPQSDPAVERRGPWSDAFRGGLAAGRRANEESEKRNEHYRVDVLNRQNQQRKQQELARNLRVQQNFKQEMQKIKDDTTTRDKMYGPEQAKSATDLSSNSKTDPEQSPNQSAKTEQSTKAETTSLLKRVRIHQH